MQEALVQFLGWEDNLKNGTSPGLFWSGVYQNTPVSWSGEFHGLYNPWGHKESDRTEQLSLSLLCFIDYTKAFDCVDHKKLWKILKEMGIPDHLTCLLRNLYAGWGATVRTEHGTQTGLGKGWVKDYWKKYQVTGSNLRYADDTTLIAESKE